MAIKEQDLVKDILARVQQIMGPTFTGDVSVKLESQIRHDWGGDRYYVARGREDVKDRNLTIIELCQSGSVTIKQVSERFQMSQRQIRRILKK